jgi:hypothetical protein
VGVNPDNASRTELYDVPVPLQYLPGVENGMSRRDVHLGVLYRCQTRKMVSLGQDRTSLYQSRALIESRGVKGMLDGPTSWTIPRTSFVTLGSVKRVKSLNRRERGK